MSRSEFTSLLSKDQLRSLMRRSDRAGMKRILLHAMVIALSVLLLSIVENWMVQGLLTIILGMFLVFLFAPLHESIHKTAFNSPVLNEVVGWICGLVLVLPPKYFQSFHMAHHRYTQIQGKDPELDSAKPESMVQYIQYLSGINYWIEQAKALGTFARGKHSCHFVSKAKHPVVVREAQIFIVIYLSLLTISVVNDSALLWKYWLLPVLIGQPFLRGFLLAEHTLCPQIKDMLKNTRTTLTNRLMRWLCWNMSFHVEHHAYPAIPFHNLPNTHTLIYPHIDVVSNGYINVHKDIIRAVGQAP